jgi:hypothetical protein
MIPATRAMMGTFCKSAPEVTTWAGVVVGEDHEDPLLADGVVFDTGAEPLLQAPPVVTVEVMVAPCSVTVTVAVTTPLCGRIVVGDEVLFGGEDNVKLDEDFGDGLVIVVELVGGGGAFDELVRGGIDELVVELV